MFKKCKKFFCAYFFSLFVLGCGVFFIPADKSFALALEVHYPVIANQTLTADTTLPSYVKYLFNAGMVLGFLAVFISLVIAGVLYLLSPAKPDLQTDAKDRAMGAISGLLILVLTYLIITTINPQLSFLKLNSLPPPPPPPTPKTAPGVYFYKNASDCPDKPAQLTTISSIADLGSSLRNQIHAVGIAQDPDTQSSYIAILYNNPGFWGKCQYITTTESNTTADNQACQAVDNFAASASVYKYDFDPESNNPAGSGVYFYRKSCFNNRDNAGNLITSDGKFVTSELVTQCNAKGGGYYKVTNSEIKDIYVAALDDLRFQGVPDSEQNCTKYDDNGKCTQKTPQSLGGENISSILINGNYLVMLVYFDPAKDTDTSWTSCQEFPISADVNKLGPRQLKWQNIRNNKGVVPNYVVIIPIKK